MTEDNKSHLKEVQNQSNAAGRQGLLQEERVTVNIWPGSQRKHKIYHISTTFPVSLPYSLPSHWQQVVSKNQQAADEDIAEGILRLRNRNWVREQIQVSQEIFAQTAASFESLKIIRKGMQIKEHFNWLVWAIAHYYFQKK